VHQLLAGGVPRQGSVVEGVKGVKYVPMQNGGKTGGFAHFLAYKSPKTPLFRSKVRNKIYSETFFEEYNNFKIFHYLKHCGVIPVQSFRSHIHPQLPG
jgi:hypothetical protein